MTELEPVAYLTRTAWSGHIVSATLDLPDLTFPERYIVEPLVTLSSAQSAIAERDARIAELEAAIDEKEIASGLTDNGSLWRFWSSRAKDVATKLAAAIARAEAAEALLKEAAEVLEPFAHVAERDISEDEFDDDVFRPMPGQYARAQLINVGHLRAARSLASKIGGGE